VKIKTNIKERLADTVTPVSLYMRLRQSYEVSILLESSDYHSSENALSFLCCQPLESYVPDGALLDLNQELQGFLNSFEQVNSNAVSEQFNGLFGFTSYDAIQGFEQVCFDEEKKGVEIPIMRYDLYRFIIVINHFNDRMYIIENRLEDEESQLADFEQVLEQAVKPREGFSKQYESQSNMSDQGFKDMVKKCKHHCQIGDVFQIVVSRRFEQQFTGDVFDLYRALRSINPSPYLFFFDYGDYQILGSSPEAQLVIADGIAEIHPIAGTFKRSGNDIEDAKEAERLLADSKENAEHVMLVDLARNDLSRNAKNVNVKRFKEVQYFSHVIHLVSRVEGELMDKNRSISMFADTFPAGTLSGAPKIKAMQLIDSMEVSKRGVYGGAIGWLGFNGNINHAITIRSFVARANHLYYQAGAGEALGMALDVAEKIQR